VTAHVRRFGEVFGLSGLALAEPLYDLLGKNPEFFSVRGASPGEIVAFAVALALVPPIAFFSLELLAGLAGRRAAVAVHLVLVGGLVAVIALEALRRVGGPTAVPIVLAALVGAAAAAGYARLRALRTVAGVLAAAPVVFLALFLLESQSSKLVLSAEAKTHVEAAKATTPVVLLVLDELPTNSLLDARRRIDPVRFPNFAAVARVTTWFPNATTVSEGTTGAVPAILSGLYPKPGQQPRLADHPDNLFTLLGGRYRQVAFERETRLCPAGLCQEDTHASVGAQLESLVEDASVVYGHLLLPTRLARNLPTVSQSWQDFLHQGRDEVVRFDRFLDRLRPSDRPTLDYLHVLLPHSPWQYLPDGTRYSLRYPVPPWTTSEFWTKDEGEVVQNWQRHLLQLAFADRLLGRFVARLRQTGLWDRALVIVTADEGIGFHAGHKRRPVWPGNLQDNAFVPLFVKLPHQTRGRTIWKHVPTMDVLPTIASVLGVRVPWRTDGRPVFAPGGPEEDEVGVLKASGERISAPLRDVLARRHADLAEQLALFGSDEPGSTLFGVGPFRGLLGRAAGRVAADGSVRLDRGRAALEVSGSVEGARAVAVAVGGRIRAVVPVYAGRFWALLPKPARRFDVLAVTGQPRAPKLALLRQA